MIGKIKIAAASGALLLAAAAPAFAHFSLPNINGQVNYVESKSSAAAYTGYNTQTVTGGSSYEYNRRGSSTDNSAFMTTGDASARSSSDVTVFSAVNARGSEHHSNETVNLDANILLGSSGAESETGSNEQTVGKRSTGGDNGAYLRTGDARSSSSSDVRVVSAINVSRSRH